MKLLKKHIIKIQIVFFVALNLSYAQHIKVPMDVQMKIIPKILSLDKNFKERKKGNYNLGIVYSSKQRNSMQIKDYFINSLEEKNMIVKKSVVNPVLINLAKITNIKKYLQDNKIDVIYITPLRGIDINIVTKICKEDKILSLTGVLDFMKNDISVSFDVKEKKLQIVINNETAKQEGTKFSSRLLRIAKLI